MKKFLCYQLLLLSAFFSLSTYAKDMYVSDHLFTYMRSGPGEQYRLTGSVNAGEKIQVLESQSNYSHIVDNKGRKGWIETKFIASQSNAARLPALEKELAQVKDSLAHAQDNSDSKQKGLTVALESRNQQIKDLEAKYQEVNHQLTTSQETIRNLQAQIDTQKDDLLMRYFSYGGAVAGIGILLGLILPSIIPRRRKKNSGWM